MSTKKNKVKKPVVIFCELRRPADEIINISSQNGAEGVVTRMLPKSHVSHVILNANVSEDRFLDMRVSTENKMQKKSMDVHDHFINNFIQRLERKQQRWIKEDNYVNKNLQLTGRQKTAAHTQAIGEFNLPTPTTAQIVYKKAKYPYASVNRPPKQDQRQSTGITFPRIQTVPAGKMRQISIKEPPLKLPPNNQDKSHFNGRWSPSATTQRANTASTVATNIGMGGRRRKRPLRNYDNRFTELMNWLSPTDYHKTTLYGRSRIMFEKTQTSF